jgi:D-alanyl-D-alanine carboxypeptidase (penicillin-binding protein 5/6)
MTRIASLLLRVSGAMAAALACTAFAAEPQPPAVAARAWLLVDLTSGQTIASHNPDERVEPASLTKLMTAYLAFSALSAKSLAPAQSVAVSERAWRSGGSRMFIEPQKPVTVQELLRGVVVQSGNDASIALAEAIAGSEDAFVERMNREAARLGLKDTHFVNSTGLPGPGHYSTASDLALLAAALIRDHPGYYKLYSEREFRYNEITQQNRNRLLWLDPNVDGMKTGYTESAGYCLVASATRGGRRLLSVVVGAASDRLRAQESQKLLNFGFQSYDGLRLFQKAETIRTLQVWKGATPELRAGVAADVYVTVPRGSADKLKAELISRQPLLAPLARGQSVATLRLLHDGRLLGEYPVVALDPVPAAGLLARAWDAVRLTFR